MTNAEFPVCQNGFQYKTINIRTTAGGLKFNLQQVNELGLPHDCLILGFWVRAHVDTTISSNNIPLVAAAVFDNSYISLKDRASKTGKIDLVLSEYHFPDLQAAKLFQPIVSRNIDWNQSFIQINPRATAVDNRVFEIVVIYSSPVNEKAFPNRLKLRTGQEFAGSRIASFEVALNVTQTEYSLSNSDNIGLPQDALILGFRCVNNQLPLFGTSSMLNQNFLCTYFTLKQGTCAFVDQYPVSMNATANLLGVQYDYVPIVPTQVMAIDWQQSKIQINDMTGLLAGTVFQFSLWWWSPDC